MTYGIEGYGYGKKDPILINEIRDYTKYVISNLEGTLYWSKGVSVSWINVAMIENSNGEFKNYRIPKSSDIEVYHMSISKKNMLLVLYPEIPSEPEICFQGQ